MPSPLGTPKEWTNCRNSRLENKGLPGLNHEYVSLLSQRLQNNKYKEKYMKMLFKFIKMRANINKHYIWDSKPYIENSLNILLNHYSMDKLLDNNKTEE